MINDEALNASQVASILHIGRNAVYDLAKTGDLPSYRIGRKMLFALKDVEAYLARARTGDAEPDGTRTAAVSETPARTADRDRSGFVIAGNGTPTDLIVERLVASGTACARDDRTSYDALCSLYEGRADAALAHLYDQRTNTYNIPFVQRLVPGVSVIVFRLVKRVQGFAVAKGNPKGISSWGALLRPETRLANRIRGCGARVLLDEKLLAMEANSETIPGYGDIFPSALLAARSVAAGAADATVAGAQIAAQVADVDFVPLQEEWLDLVVVKSQRTRPLIRGMRSMLDDAGFRAEYARIVHGDPANLGTIVYEC